MTFIYPREIQKTDEQNTDAFNRLRTAEPFTQLEFKQTRGSNPLQIVSKTVGTGAIVNEPTTSSSLLSVTTTGDRVVQQTLGKATYQPGKSLLCFVTGVPDASGTNASTVTTRAGIYDDNNGVFFEYVGNGAGAGTFYACTRINGVDTKVASSSWNGDPNALAQLATLDPTKAHLFGFDCEWLGVGSVRYYIFLDGEQYRVHSAHHANSVTVPYSRNLNVPMRYEIVSTGGAGSVRSICGQVSSEGGYFPSSLVFSANRGITAQTLSTGQNEPLVAIRYKSTGSLQNSRIDLRSLSVITVDSTPFLYRLWFCPPGSGTLTTPSWVSADANSALEYDISSTAFTSTGCTLIQSGYSSQGNDASDVIKNELKLGVDVDGVSAIIVLEVVNITGNNQDYLGALSWSEYF